MVAGLILLIPYVRTVTLVMMIASHCTRINGANVMQCRREEKELTYRFS